MHTLDLSGQVALVTGAARGIGRAIAAAFAEAGADLALADVRGDAVRRAGAELAAATGRRAHALEVDVRDAAAVRRMVEDTVAGLGRLDVLVNNAGGTFEAPFLQANARGSTALLHLNLGSIWHGTQS